MITTRSTKRDGVYSVFMDGEPIGFATVHRKNPGMYCGFVLNKENGGDGAEWHFKSLQELRLELASILRNTTGFRLKWVP